MADRIRQQKDLYVTSTTYGNYSTYPYNPDLLNKGPITHYNNGIIYKRGSTSWWTITGTATADSSFEALRLAKDPNVTVDPYFDEGTKYSLQLDSESSGDIVQIYFTFLDANNQTISEFEYPSSSDYTDGILNPKTFAMTSQVQSLRVKLFVPANKTVNSNIRYILSVDSRKMHFEYGQSYTLTLAGGSGTGTIHYSIQSLTGKGTISSTVGTSAVIAFAKPGKILLKAYKDGSAFSVDPDTGAAVDGYYEKSRTLVVELTLNQRQLEVVVQRTPYDSTTRDWVYNVGDPIPSAADLQNHTSIGSFPPGEDIYYFDGSAVEVFIVNDSDDYYKFDVFSKSSGLNTYDNGIKYQVNTDGSLHVSGSLTESGYSYYRFITSVQELPNYLLKGRSYRLHVNGTIPVMIRWYDSEGARAGDVYYSTGSSTYDVYVDPSYTGVEISLRIFGNAGTSFDQTIFYHMFDITDRGVDNMHASEYAVAARGAKPPYKAADPNAPMNFGYDSQFKYRSAKLIYRNIRSYSIYPQYDWTKGTITVLSSAKPYTSITFTITANSGLTFDDNFYEAGHNTLQVYETWTGNKVNYEPIGAPTVTSVTVNGVNKLVSRSYRFTMPITDVIISCSFYKVTKQVNKSDFPFSSYSYTYEDVYPYGYSPAGSYSYPAIIFNSAEINQEYRNALIFNRWAYSYYFGETTRCLIELPQPGFFYDQMNSRNPATTKDGYKIHAVRRREIAETLRRISHGPDRSPPSWSQVSIYPDEVFTQQAYTTNTPDARVFTYAGYNYPHKSGTRVQPTDVDQTGAFGKVILQNPTTDDTAAQYNTTYGGYFMPAVGWHSVVRGSINPYQYRIGDGANDDYLANYFLLEDIAWSSWIGALKGYNNREAGANAFATYQEIALILWRYAKFRQFDIFSPGTYPVVTDESSAATWAQTGAIRWLESHGISRGYHCVYYDYDSNFSQNIYGGTGMYSPMPMSPTDPVDRLDFAYMVMKLCQLYAW